MAKCKIEFAFFRGDKVKITELKRPGFVLRRVIFLVFKMKFLNWWMCENVKIPIVKRI